VSLEPTAESATDDNTTAYSNVAQPASVKSPNAVSESRFVRSVAPTERKSRVCVSSAQTFSRMCQNTTLGETVFDGGGSFGEERGHRGEARSFAVVQTSVASVEYPMV